MPDPISWAFAWPYLGAALLFGYLLGSIPFGVVLTRLAGAADPRSVGSGNIGATNVLRTGRKDLAAATLALDLAKGAAAVLIASRWGIDISVMAGFGAMLGHMLPVWLRFRGGKGVATYLGVLAGLFWPAALVFAGLWLVVAYATRYSSLAALLATVTAPFVMWASDEAQLMEVTVIIGLAIFLAHRGNIFRLATGREARIGDDR